MGGFEQVCCAFERRNLQIVEGVFVGFEANVFEIFGLRSDSSSFGNLSVFHPSTMEQTQSSSVSVAARCRNITNLHEQKFSIAAVFTIQIHDCMAGRARACKEIAYAIVRFR